MSWIDDTLAGGEVCVNVSVAVHLGVCVCVCVCVYMCECVCVSVCMCMHGLCITCTHLSMRLWILLCDFITVFIFVHVFLSGPVSVHLCAYICMCLLDPKYSMAIFWPVVS